MEKPIKNPKNFSHKKLGALFTAIFLIALLAGSIGATIAQQTWSPTNTVLDVNISGPTHLGAGQTGNYIATVSQTGVFVYNWTVTPTDNIFISPNGSRCDLTFTYATNETYSLQCKVRGSSNSAGVACISVVDPFVPPNIALDDLPSTADYVIKTDGLGNYWATASNGSICFTSTNASSIFNTLCNIKGNTIQVSSGTYTVTSPLVINASWVTINGDNAGYSKIIGSSDAISPLIEIYTRVVLNNIYLGSSTTSNTSIGVMIHGPYSNVTGSPQSMYSELNSVLFRNFGIGLYLDGVHYITVGNCDFYNCYDSIKIMGNGLSLASQFIFFNDGKIEQSRNSPIIANYAHFIDFTGTYIGNFQASVLLLNFKEVTFTDIQFEPDYQTVCINVPTASGYHQNLNILESGFSNNASYALDLNDIVGVNLDNILLSFNNAGTTFVNCVNCSQATLGHYSYTNGLNGLLTSGSISVLPLSGYTLSGANQAIDSTYKAATPMFIKSYGVSGNRADASILITKNCNVTSLTVNLLANTFDNVCAVGIWNGTVLVNYNSGVNVFNAGGIGSRTVYYTNFPVKAGDYITVAVWAGVSTSSGTVMVGTVRLTTQD